MTTYAPLRGLTATLQAPSPSLMSLRASQISTKALLRGHWLSQCDKLYPSLRPPLEHQARRWGHWRRLNTTLAQSLGYQTRSEMGRSGFLTLPMMYHRTLMTWMSPHPVNHLYGWLRLAYHMSTRVSSNLADRCVRGWNNLHSLTHYWLFYSSLSEWCTELKHDTCSDLGCYGLSIRILNPVLSR